MFDVSNVHIAAFLLSPPLLRFISFVLNRFGDRNMRKKTNLPLVEQTAGCLSVGENTLCNWRKAGNEPQIIPYPGYRKAYFDAFLEQRTALHGNAA